MRIWLALTAAMALAACDANVHESEHSGEQSGAGMEFAADDVAAADSTMSDNRIPTRFLGVWDFVDGTCARESDLRIEVSPHEVMFYEAVGSVTKVSNDDAATFVTLMMDGEGEQWEEEYALSLSDDGSVLTAQFTRNDTPNPPMPRKRCAI